MPRRKRLMPDSDVDEFMRILSETIVPESELDWESPLDLLLAVVLSAQTTDKAVNKVTAWFRENCPEPKDYLELGEAGIQDRIRSIGLYRNKTKSIVGICQALIDTFDGEVPDNRKDLESLPGVGRKTANVVLNVLYGHPTLAVDTHIFRVANRVKMVAESTPEKTEQALLKRIPETYLRHAHHYLILHGRYTCVARKPNCGECLVKQYCLFEEKTV